MRRRHVNRLAAFLLAAALVVAGAGADSARAAHRTVRRAAPDSRARPSAPAADPARLAERDALRTAQRRLAERWGRLFQHDLPRTAAIAARARAAGLGWREMMKAAESAPDRRDTLRIAAFRFEFENDTAGDATTGDCRFDLSAPDESDIIDPPPHNRAYFDSHFRALRRYWDAASSGRLYVEWTIFPAEDSAAYRLNDSQDYLPEGDPASWTFDSRGCGISRLVRDWIAHIDSSTTVQFSDYNSYLFIHAGPDLQGDVNQDTPGDIPSFNITFAFPDSLCEIDSIFVHDDDGEARLLDNAWVIPEQISQDFFVGALNGTLTHESGHQIGLPDLYDTYAFFPSIGIWDLMDSGDSQAIDVGLDSDVSGLIPGGLSAWSRFFLGWERPVVVSDFLEVDSLYASTLPDFAGLDGRPDPGLSRPFPGRRKSILIPMSPREYYLIENRQSELDGDPTPIVDADDSTGVVLGPARLEIAGGDTTEVPNYEYDFPLPGYGALVWHVDERSMNEPALEGNFVNVNPYRRGLRLEEADGIPDIGNYYSVEYRGGPFDPFFEGNNDRFDPTSIPNSRSNDDTETGISVTQISEPGFLMSFRVDLAPRIPGFPVVLGDSLKERRSLLVGPTVGDAGLDGAAHLAAVVGSDYLRDATLADSVRAGGRLFGVPLPAGSAPVWSRALPESITIPCAVGDFDRSQIARADEVVILGDSGSVYVFGGEGAPYPGADSTGRVADLPGVFLLPPLVVRELTSGPTQGDPQRFFILATGDSGVFRVSVSALSDPAIVVRSGRAVSPPASNPIVNPRNPEQAWFLTADGGLASFVPFPVPIVGTTSPFPELAADISFMLWGDIDRSTPENEWVAVSRTGSVTAGTFGGERLPGWPVKIDAEVLTFPSLGDLDGDGTLEILIPGEDGRVYCLNWNGSRRVGWPVTLPERVDGAVIAGETPLVAEFDDLAGCEVIVGIRDGRAMAYDASGRVLPGWPYGAGEPFQYTPVLAPVSPTDGLPPVLALLTAPYDGFLYALQLRAEAPAGTIQWAGIGRDGAHSAGIGADDLGPVVGRDTALLVASKTFAYPNPARGAEAVIRCRLGRDARVAMKIFDLSGEIVHEMSPTPRPAGDNDFRWDVTTMANGVYLCDLSVVGGGETSSTLVKIAVLR